MPEIIRALLFLSLVLCACSPGGLSPESPPANEPTAINSEAPTEELHPAQTSEVLPPPKLAATLSTPHIDQGPDGAGTPVSSYGGCGYQWAYKDLPELSVQFLQSIQVLQSDAQANAFAFGEDCVHADGTRTFIAMETDFNITLQISDLSNEADLGEWIVKVMQVIEDIPADQIVGPRPGRVTLIFQSNGQQQGINFYIDQYQALPAGLSNAEIYRALQIQ